MTQSIGAAWRAVRDRFRAAGLDTPELDARWLAEAAFGLDGGALTLRERDAVTGADLAALEAFALRRLAGEPVARILGHKQFYGLVFALNAATLVPRPETELLVDLALGFLAGRPDAAILDLGTGTGCIAISVLANAASARGVAVDLSLEALEAAHGNAEANGVADRLEYFQGSWFGALGSPPPLIPPHKGEGETTFVPLAIPGTAAASPSPLWGGIKGGGGNTRKAFDLILSNPPYIESAIVPTLSREVRDHDPALALDGGPDGLAPYRIIAAESPAWLKPNGVVMVEIGAGQGAAVAKLFEIAGFSAIAVKKDLSGLDRVVIAHHS